MFYQDKVFFICLGFSKDPSTAEELAQEVFLKAYQKLNTLKDISAAAGWLLQIARNTCRDYVRKERIRKNFRLQYRPADCDINVPETQMIEREDRKRLKNAVRGLPQKLQEVFVLHEYGELSYFEIARILGLKQGTVMSRLNRGRKAVLLAVREGADEGK